MRVRLCNKMKAFFKRVFIATIERRLLTTLLGLKSPGLLVRQIDMFLSRLAIRLTAWRYPIEPNKILFTNFSGNYDCNPKYICEEVLHRELPGEKIWVVWGEGPHKNDTTEGRYPSELTLRTRYSWPFYKDLFTARVIVDNGTSFASAGYRKRRGQYLINTFHGSLGIKCLPRNTSIHNWAYNHNARKASSMIDVVISNSAFEEKYYRETYFDGVPVLRLGHARNDPLFRTENGSRESDKRKVAVALGLSESSRICLYAPTFRDSDDIRPYALPYEKLREALAARWGGEWIILTRFHHRTKVVTKGLSFPKGVVSATNYPDIVELMVAADVGITDYSSWICEFIHTGRPGFLYAPDMTDFESSERAFYDPLDQMPFPLATDSDALLQRIQEFDETEYARACATFLKQKECMDDGHAASRIVDLIASKC